MQTVTKYPFLALTALTLLPFSNVWAQDMASATLAPSVTMPAVVSPAPETAANAQPSMPSADDSGDESGSSPRIPASIKAAVKKLDSSAKGASIEDLNAAREASAKLDLLLDIEKKLQELDKIRGEREGMSGLSSAIPASALGGGQMSAAPMPQAFAPMAMPAPMPVATPAVFPGAGDELEVLRIAGAGGRYVAYIKDGDNAAGKILREGDTTPGGSVVQSISRYGVALKNGQKTKTVQVKDVGAVFGPK